MVDFDALRHKAEDFAEKHADQVDRNIDKAADELGRRYGHDGQIDQGAEKLKDFLPGEGEPDKGTKHRP